MRFLDTARITRHKWVALACARYVQIMAIKGNVADEPSAEEERIHVDASGSCTCVRACDLNARIARDFFLFGTRKTWSMSRTLVVRMRSVSASTERTSDQHEHYGSEPCEWTEGARVRHALGLLALVVATCVSRVAECSHA